MTTAESAATEEPQDPGQLVGGPSPIRMPSETFGEFAARMNTWLATPRGQNQVLTEQRHRTAEIQRYLSERKRRLSAEWGIPERYRFMGDPGNVPVETFALKAVKQHVGEMLVLSGCAGCGKTAAACWWLYQTPNEAPSLFVTGARLARMSRFDEEIMATVINAERLVIDDLAVEYQDDKGSFVSLLDEIVNERYANKRQTLITTNVTVDVFKSRCGERITDRVREAGEFVSVKDPSLRQGRV